jgi:mRNA-degrading endonuclease HigB of HigAB toxin-antitoxin module
MKKLLLFLILVLTAMAAKSQVPDFAWVKQAQGQYSGNNEEFGQSIARDNLGNSYVTGYFYGGVTFGSTTLISSGGYDVFIAKYDAAGHVLWAKKAGGLYDDNSNSIAVDGSGNSYITGYFYGSATFGSTTLTSSGSGDVFVAKYDASGNAVWAMQPATGSLQGTRIAVDGPGNSYLTGYFYGSATFGNTTLTNSSGSGDLFVAKYDAAGNVLWANQASGTDYEYGQSITVDGSGNSYVTGYFYGSATFGNTTLISSGNDDVFIAKYDTSGNVIWAKEAVGTDYEYANGIVVDGSGNSYVTGYFYGSATFGDTTLTSSNGSDDVFIAKYDTAGNVLWATQTGGIGDEYGQSIAVDGSGNSYVTGNFSGSATFGSNILTNTSGSDDVFIVKYDAAGNVIWAKQSGGTGDEYGQSIAVDGSGNSYVTGNFSGSAAFGSTTLTSTGNSDAFVAKYDAAGNELWDLNPVGFSADDFGRSVATDAAGNSYVTGSFQGKITFGNTTLTSSGFSENQDFFIAKYNAAGNVLWAKQAVGTDYKYGNGIAVDGSGNSYVTGNFYGSATFGSTTLTSGTGIDDAFIAKYDAAGNVIWAKQTVGTDYEYGNGIAVDASGNSYVTGYFYGSAIFGSTTLNSSGNNDVFVAKYDAMGNAIWARNAGGTNTRAYGFGIALDSSGNSHVTGFFIGSATFGNTTLTSSGNYDIFVAKYDAAGNPLWAKKAGSSNEDRGYGIAVDGSGNAYVTGSFQNTITFGSTILTSGGFGDVFVAKFDAAGNALWARKAGGASGDYANGIALDGSGNSYVTGYFYGSAAFGSTTLTSSGSYDVFIAKYDAAGNVLWAKQTGGTGDEFSQSIALDGSGKSYITGRFSGSAAFGSTTLITPGHEMFLARITEGNAAPTGLALSAASVNENVSANTTVGALTTTDPDADNTFTYSLVPGPGGADNAAFTLTGDSLKIINSPDFETRNSYSIRIRTTDQGGLFFEKAFTIIVNDLNETPVNLAVSANAVDENIALNTIIGSLSATDPDAGNTFTYSLISGTGSTDNAAFNISGDSLRITAAADYEVKSSYSIRIRTTDQGGLFYENAIGITINNVNETPANLELSANAVNENVPANTTIGSFSTTDPDTSNTFTYSLVTGIGSTDNAAFNISGDSLRITASPDFEAKNSYSIRIRTTDQGGLFFEKAFVITINDVNETTVVLSASSVLENVLANSTIGNLSTTGAVDGSTFTYSLVTGTGSTDNAAFSLLGTSLRIKSSPNFEAKNSYSIRIRTTDQRGLFFEKAFAITVNDVNETPTNPALSATALNENVAANSMVGSFTTTDPDAGNIFTYSLVTGIGSTDNAAFNISGDSLRITASPDFEAKNSYSVRIRVTDQGGLFFEKTFTITIKNVNETPANLALSASSVNENVLANTTVGTLSTTDPDAGNTFTYSLVTDTGSTDNAAFNIYGKYLRITSSPNFEAKSSYYVRIRATDQGGLFFEKAFAININDLNEKPANLALSATSVNENVAAFTTIGNFSSTDQDPGNTFTYSLISGTGSTDNAAFKISSDSLRIIVSPNFEAKKSYSVRIRTTDQGGLFFDKAFTITVINVNETPANLALSASSVNENVLANTTVGTLSTTDPDAGNTFTYSLVTDTGSTDNAAFNIYGKYLRITSSPNFEAKSSYYVRIRATDQGGLFFEKAFAININDLNEKPANLALSATSVNENVAAFTTIGNFSSTDQDPGNTFTYSLISGTGSTDNAAFKISSDSLRIIVSPNFEAKKSYSVRIRTTDQGGLFFDKAFTITVINVNETPANLALSASSVNENIAANTTIGNFSTTDPDAGNTFTYSLVTGIGSTDNLAFDLISNSLQITSSPDFETKNSYSILIRTTDQGGLYFEKTFTIVITNVNETPTDLALSADSVNENVAANTTVGTFATTDPDAGNTFTYLLVTGTGSTDNAAFSVSGNSLRVKNAPNFEVKSSYTVRIRATDQGGLFFEKAFTINVNDVNDTPVNLALSATSVYENVAANTIIGNLSSTDPDPGNTFTYSLVTGTGSIDNAAFTLAGDSLKIINSPDFETKKSYNIRIRTTDQGGLFVEKAFVISIININETPVNLTLSATSVNENVVANTTVGTFVTTDLDAGNAFTYSLVTGTGSTDNASFTIYRNVLWVKSAPNFEAKSSYTVRIRSTDQGGLFFEKAFVISINNVNETPVNLTLSATSVNENVAANTTVGTFATTDPDAGNAFTYSLVTGTGSTNNAAFNISGDSLRITASPDFEVKNSYNIRIRTTDQGGLFFEKPFTIIINDVNENKTITYNNLTETSEEVSKTGFDVLVYPNPSTGKFTLELSNSKDADLVVIDLSGKMIMQKKLNSVNGKVQEALELKAAKGIYLLRIKADDHWVTKKLVVE